MTVPVEALQLLLQNADVCHSVSRANSTVLQLMSTAKAVQEMVEQHCSGCLCVSFSSKDASEFTSTRAKRAALRRESSFGAWLRKHCHLLKSLHLDDTASESFEYSHLLPALRAAAACPSGLQLVSFSSETPDNNSLEVLQLLPASKLSHLGMCITNAAPDLEAFEAGLAMEADGELDDEDVADCYFDYLHGFRTEHDDPQMAATLATFSKLASFSIGGYETLLAESPTMGVMSQLTSLTKLSFDSVLTTEGLQELQLPVQLRELELLHLNRPALHPGSGFNDTPLPTLSWGHLTALTRLHTKGYYEGLFQGVWVRQHDVLPPNLVSLCIGGCAALASLTSLPSLRQLSIASLEDLEGLPQLPEARTQPHGSTCSHPSSSNTTNAQQPSKAEQVAAARLEQLQAKLPAVQIRVTKGWAVKDFNCFCCSGDSA